MTLQSHIKSLQICILFFAYCPFMQAQNFIPDSSFEKNKSIPMDFSGLGVSYTWSIPSWGTSDLFCKCDRKTKLFTERIYSNVDVPQNPMGYQYPHSGTCYAGIFAFSHGSYREYIQTPLTAPLEKNKSYLFTMYISLADYSPVCIDQLGVCFLDDAVEYKSPNVITDLKPIYMKVDKKVGKNIEDWHQVTVIYKAHGGEKQLLIGSFEIKEVTKTKLKVPKEIKVRLNQTKGRDAYYFIDDVSLLETISIEPMDTVIQFEPELAQEIPFDTSLVFKNVLFQTNKSVLLPSSFPELDLVQAYLTNNPKTRVEIIGHTDNAGNEKANKKLSIERAKAVSDYFIAKGIDKSRIAYDGYGSSRSVASNDTKEGRRRNRRVEFKIISN